MKYKIPKIIAYFRFVNSAYLNINVLINEFMMKIVRRAYKSKNSINRKICMILTTIIHKDHRISPCFLLLSLSFLCKCFIQKNRNTRNGKITITVRYLDIISKKSPSSFKNLSKKSFTYCHNKWIAFPCFSNFAKYNT